MYLLFVIGVYIRRYKKSWSMEK